MKNNKGSVFEEVTKESGGKQIKEKKTIGEECTSEMMLKVAWGR